MFLYKDLNAPDSLKRYYTTQGYFFVFLAIISFVISFLDKKIHSYFFIILFSSIMSFYLFESFIFYKGKIKLFMSSEEHYRNDNRALQNEIKKKGGNISISLRENSLISFSGISNSKIIFCNEDSRIGLGLSDMMLSWGRTSDIEWMYTVSLTLNDSTGINNTSLVLLHISSGFCSTQPFFGKYWLISN